MTQTRGSIRASQTTPRCSKSTDSKCSKRYLSIVPPYWKMANADSQRGSPCLALHFWTAYPSRNGHNSCRKWSWPPAQPCGRQIIGSWTTVDFASQHGTAHHSSRKNSATTCSVGLYTRQCTCYIFLPYRHPCARRLG